MKPSSSPRVSSGSTSATARLTLGPGELYVVPRGVEHKPFAATEVKMMLIEPKGVANTGAVGGERTAANDVWILTEDQKKRTPPKRGQLVWRVFF